MKTTTISPDSSTPPTGLPESEGHSTAPTPDIPWDSRNANIHTTLRGKGGIDKYPAKSHAQRVAAKLGLEKGIILLKGEKQGFYSYPDQPQPFRQHHYFYYMTGCNEPSCYVTYDVDRDVLTLWLPPIHLKRVYYDVRGSTTEEAMEKYDIDQAIYTKAAENAPISANSLDSTIRMEANALSPGIRA